MNMSSPDDEGYITVSTRIAYENPWTRVRKILSAYQMVRMGSTVL